MKNGKYFPGQICFWEAGEAMQGKLAQLKCFHWRLWLSLCALSLVPAVYETVKTALISSAGRPGAFDIIGQMEWFDLINETLQAFLIVPLYSVLNRVFKERRKTFAGIVFKTGVCVFALYSFFSIGVLLYGTNLIGAMNPGEIDLFATALYLRLESVAFAAGILVSFAGVVFVVIGKDKNVYLFLCARMGLLILADFWLIPKLSVYGAAVANVIVNALLSAICLFLLYKQGYLWLCRIRKSDGRLVRDWCKTGLLSGLQQFMDNFIYAVMICKMVNMVAEQGNYWIANNFIWGWLLIPVTALCEVIRSDCKDGYRALNRFSYFFIASASAVLWLITVPIWDPFFRVVQRLENPGEIFAIAARLVPFYVAYAGSAVIDNIFIGLGKTEYNAVNSLLINLGYYGVFYILYRMHAIVFTMQTILLMFGFGMVAHFMISMVQLRLFRRRGAGAALSSSRNKK